MQWGRCLIVPEWAADFASDFGFDHAYRELKADFLSNNLNQQCGIHPLSGSL